MRWAPLCFLLLFSLVQAQKVFPLDEVKLQGVTDAMVDDYANVYLYKNQNFSWTKYDNQGKEIGRLMLTQPFQIQEVQNPLTIPMFSKNAQKIQLVDGYLTEIQMVDLSFNFGNITNAYIEDLQQVWLLDEANHRLLQYFYRDNKVINSFPVSFSFSGIQAMMVYQQKILLMRDQSFEVYDFYNRLLYQQPISNGKKIQRENDVFYLLCQHEIIQVDDFFGKSKSIFQDLDAEILAKNSNSIFVIKENKIYIYPFK
ncbi:MAG: hypothetical protein JSS94_07825 [Bacteroidetes bacterium]|nr:hypothetical protein [Bacteroidota bacterium]